MRTPSRQRALVDALERQQGLRPVVAHSEQEVLQQGRQAGALIIEADDGRPLIETLRVLDSVQSELAVLVLAPVERADPIQLLEAGAMVILDADAATAQVMKTLRALLRGEVSLDADIAARVVRRMQELSRLCVDQGIDMSRCENLSPRERDVISLMAKGASNEDIGAALGVSTGTVKTHVHKILRKLKVENRRLASAYWRLFLQVRG